VLINRACRTRLLQLPQRILPARAQLRATKHAVNRADAADAPDQQLCAHRVDLRPVDAGRDEADTRQN
jgi:hypothetical protein